MSQFYNHLLTVSSPPIIDSPLRTAVSFGKDEVVRLFLNFLEQHSLKPYDDSEMLYLAAKYSHPSTVELFIHPPYHSYNKRLVDAIGRTESVEVFDRLLPLAEEIQGDRDTYGGFRPNCYSSNFLPSRLARAAQCGNIKIMERVIEMSAANPDHLFKDPSSTPSMCYSAARHGHTKALSLLLKHGALINVSALHLALQGGRTKMAKLVLEHLEPGFEVEIFLHYAFKKEDAEMLRMLLDVAQPHVENTVGIDAYRKAVEKGYESMLDIVTEFFEKWSGQHVFLEWLDSAPAKH